MSKNGPRTLLWMPAVLVVCVVTIYLAAENTLRLPSMVVKTNDGTILGPLVGYDSGRDRRVGLFEGVNRRGVIAALIQNGLRPEVTRITSTFSTLREFTWIDDVATHIADDLPAPYAPGFHLSLLASAQPSGTFEILRLVRRGVVKSLYVYFADEVSNRADITFAPAGVPSSWRTADPETAIHRIFLQAVAFPAGAAGPA